MLLLASAVAGAQSVSPDGTTIAGGTGSLTNTKGTWSFGDPAPGRPGEWLILLNNSFYNNGGIGAELEVANGGQVYALTAYGNWWVWTAGGWVVTDTTPLPPLSPDGAVISDGAGTLTTAAGTWSFGAEANGRPGEWLILLNGDASNGGISTSLEIAAGGQVYAQTANGSWWVDLNGHGWMRTDAPPMTITPPSTATLTVTCNPQMATIPDNSPPGTVISIVTATWSDGSPFTGSFMFAPPYGDDGGRFILSCVQCDVANVMINPRGPGLSADTGTTRHTTVAAIQ